MYAAVLVPDPLLPQYQLTFMTNNLGARLSFAAISQLSAFVVPFAGLFVFLYVARFRNLARALILSCIVFCLATWTVLAVVQTRAPYATIYEYGRVGGREVSDLVARQTGEDAVIVAPLEIIYAAHRSGEFVNSLLVPPNVSVERWLQFFRTEYPAAYVLTTKEDGRYVAITRNRAVQEYLARCYAPPTTIGTYLIYLRAEKPELCTVPRQ